MTWGKEKVGTVWRSVRVRYVRERQVQGPGGGTSGKEGGVCWAGGVAWVGCVGV